MSPEPLPVDRVECARCRMLISTDSGGGEIVSATEDTRFYDDIGCLAADWEAHHDDARAYVRVAGGWRDVQATSFAQPADARTAMGSGCRRVRDAGRSRPADRAGRALTFGDDRANVGGGTMIDASVDDRSAGTDRGRPAEMDSPADGRLRTAGRGRGVLRGRRQRAVRRRGVRADDDGARPGRADSGAAVGADPRRVGSGLRAGQRAVPVRPAGESRDRSGRPLARRVRRARQLDRDRAGHRRRHRRLRQRRGWRCRRFVFFVLASVVLAIIFLSIAAAIAAATEKRVVALGVAIFAWFFFVLLYDGAALSLAGWLTGSLGGRMLFGSVFGNPADLIRVVTLSVSGTPNVLGAAGDAWVRFLGGTMGAAVSAVVALTMWTLAPLFVGVRLIEARDL